MSDIDLYILKKYLFIPLLLLSIPILWSPALQCSVESIVLLHASLLPLSTMLLLMFLLLLTSTILLVSLLLL
jgi:hypothetical protein